MPLKKPASSRVRLRGIMLRPAYRHLMPSRRFPTCHFPPHKTAKTCCHFPSQKNRCPHTKKTPQTRTTQDTQAKRVKIRNSPPLRARHHKPATPCPTAQRLAPPIARQSSPGCNTSSAKRAKRPGPTSGSLLPLPWPLPSLWHSVTVPDTTTCFVSNAPSAYSVPVSGLLPATVSNDNVPDATGPSPHNPP